MRTLLSFSKQTFGVMAWILWCAIDSDPAAIAVTAAAEEAAPVPAGLQTPPCVTKDALQCLLHFLIRMPYRPLSMFPEANA